jgi:hypothetical protein
MALAGRRTSFWAPNIVWRAAHGWPQLAMASALHRENGSAADYAGGLPTQILYLGLLAAPLVIVGFIRLWRIPELRFLAVAVTLIVVYVVAWVLTRAIAAQDATLVRAGQPPPRSLPDTTENPPRSTSSAQQITCRACSPATTPTGCRDPPPTAPCSWSTRSASYGPASPAAAC